MAEETGVVLWGFRKFWPRVVGNSDNEVFINNQAATSCVHHNRTLRKTCDAPPR